MHVIVVVLLTLYSLGAGIYTINYGRWAWRKKNKRGALGLFLVAGVTFLVPVIRIYSGRGH
jgi:hypothetical protein